MRRFKLIKEYPCSPKIGSIQTISSTINNLEKEYIDFPEYWEEVIEYPIGTRVFNSISNCIYTKKEDGWYRPGERTAYTDNNISKSKGISVISEEMVEKDYEILSLKYRNELYNRFDGTYWYDSLYKIITDDTNRIHIDSLNSNDIIIYSIRRLSDGEIFTVGDKINFNIHNCSNPTDTIKEFIIIDNAIKIKALNFTWGSSLDIIQNIKQPLFTTKDGVDIYEGDFAYECCRSNSIFNHVNKFTPLEQCRDTYKTIGIDWIVFSTEETAKEYILMNKLIFTVTDVLLYLDIFGNIVKDVQKERVKTIAKSKL